MTLFWEKGYHATSLKDLEAALRMKPGSIYAAFDSKENLFALSLERYFTRNHAALQAEFAAAPTPLVGLANFLRSIAQAEAGTPKRQACFLVKSLLNTTQSEARIRDQVSDYLGQMEALMAAFFTQAKQSGQLPASADVEALARRYQSDVTALRIEAQRGLPHAQLTASAERLAKGIEDLAVLN